MASPASLTSKTGMKREFLRVRTSFEKLGKEDPTSFMDHSYVALKDNDSRKQEALTA